MSWWHGGPSIFGRYILPASQTGAVTTAQLLAGDEHWEALAARVYNEQRIYVINSFPMALIYASVHPTPWVYLVEPIGELEVDPDYTPDGDDDRSMCCPAGLILKRYKPANETILEVRKAILALDDSP